LDYHERIADMPSRNSMPPVHRGSNASAEWKNANTATANANATARIRKDSVRTMWVGVRISGIELVKAASVWRIEDTLVR
jgi:hypothetical protein